MSGTTIKDVVIKVGIEASMSAAVDGLKGIESAASKASIRIKELEANVAALQQIMANVASGVSQGVLQLGQLDSDISGVPSQQRRSGNSGGSRRNWGGPDPGSFAARILNQGSASSDLAERMAQEGATFPNANEKKTRMADATEAQRQRELAHKADEADRASKRKSHEEMKQGVSDNDVANGVKATQQAKEDEKQTNEEAARATRAGADANAAYQASATGAAMGAMEFARGLTLVVASGDKADEAMIRNVIAVQGYFRVMSGGINTLNSFGNAMNARSAAQTAGGTAGGAAAAGGAAGAAAVVPASRGMMASLMNPWVALAAAAVATGLAIRGLGVATKEEEKESRRSNTRSAGYKEELANTMTGKFADHAIRMSHVIPNIAAIHQASDNQRGRSVAEIQIRRAQKASPRDFGAKQEIRARGEQEQGFRERDQETSGNVRHKTDVKNKLAQDIEEFEASKKESKAAYDNKVATINAQHLETAEDRRRKNPQQQNAKPGWFGKGSVLRYIVTGEDTDSQAQQHNLKVGVELKGAESSRAGQENAELEQGIKLKQRQLEVDGQLVQSAAERLEFLRNQSTAARKNYEQDKQTQDATSQAVGAMTPGERSRLKEMEAKRIRMEGDPDKGIKGSGETWYHWEKENGGRFQGTKLGDSIRKANELQGQGVLASSADVTKSKGKADKADASLDNEEGELLILMKNQSKKNEDASKELLAAVQGAFNSDKSFEELKAAFKEYHELMMNRIKGLTRMMT